MFCAIVRIVSIFLSTLSLRRATVSVFNLLMGELNFYPRSPCGERLYQWRVHQQHKYFYPRSPCGERPNWHTLHSRRIWISIHALLAESDDDIIALCRAGYTFLSTLSLRRATGFYADMMALTAISIHALLAESDRWPNGSAMWTFYFYPRSPCGERRFLWCSARAYIPISIHALLAESDRHASGQGQAADISIHALLAESDPLQLTSSYRA